jgi:putative transposase/transposase-like zinc-binding protein
MEVADIIREHGAALVEQYGAVLTAEQRQALRDLERCRTAALGGHRAVCDRCGSQHVLYHSCRNRHCPKCQGGQRAAWLERESAYLLPVEYFHVVFTLPAVVAELALVNRRRLYGLLFEAASTTLRQVAATPKHLGAEVGTLLVLHTWGQNLHHHPHVHGIVTGGGLSCDATGRVEERPRWVSCRPGFFLPVRVLSRVFRGKYLAGVRHLYERGQLRLPETLTEPLSFAAWLTSLYRQDWVVYAKPPFGGPEQVLKYLARYTHRVAVSNGRLVSLDEGQVSFTARDYAAGGQRRLLRLSGVEFLRRFVQHVLPRGFVKVRHYGLLSNRVRAAKLALCRWLLVLCVLAGRARALPPVAMSVATVPAAPACPTCGVGCLVRLAVRVSGEGAGPPCDSS